MTAPSIRIEIGFNATSYLGTFFVLDDYNADGTTAGPSTLDNTTNTLAGTTFVDVTDYVSGQVSVTRGRSRETDQYAAGTMSFQLRNEDRRFDPSNTAGPYYPGPQPRLQVNAYMAKGLAEIQIFSGYIDDLDIGYEVDGVSVVNVSCIDAYSVLSNSYLRSFAVMLGWSTGRAIRSALKTTGYASAYVVDNGLTTVKGSTQDKVTVLDFAQLMAKTENGFLFVDGSGVLRFKNRHFTGFGTIEASFSDVPADWPASVDYVGITQRAASTLLYNEVSATRDGGTAQVVSDSTSIGQFMKRALDISGLQNKDDTDVLNLAYYMLGRYSQPDLRFDNVTVELAGLSDDQATTLLGLELTDTVTVKRTPPGTGSPTSTSMSCLIDGISISADASSGSFRVTYNLSALRSRQTFILDDSSLGVLDTSKLDY
jgi:hypothetical protein